MGIDALKLLDQLNSSVFLQSSVLIDCLVFNDCNDKPACFWTHRISNFVHIFRYFYESLMDSVFGILLVM